LSQREAIGAVQPTLKDLLQRDEEEALSLADFEDEQ
jgi:hypothetical protein